MCKLNKAENEYTDIDLRKKRDRTINKILC